MKKRSVNQVVQQLLDYMNLKKLASEMVLLMPSKGQLKNILN